MSKKKGLKKLKGKLNVPIVVGLILLSLGAYYAGGTYLMTMFPNRPCIQFWVYQADPTTSKGYVLPNGTTIHGIGIEGVKVEVWDTVDIPPIIPTGETSCVAYTRTWGLTFFQFAFEEQLDRVWYWKATFPDGTVHSGALYLPIEGVDILILVEKTKGLTYIHPADLLRTTEEETPTVTASILINNVEAGDEPLYLKTSRITVKIVPSDISKVMSIRATIDGKDLSLQRMDTYYIADLTLQDGRHVLTVYINEVELASIGIRIESNWINKIMIGIVSAVAGIICIFAGVRKK